MKSTKVYSILSVIGAIILMVVSPGLFTLLLGSAAVYIGIKALIFMQKIQKKGIKCMGRILFFQADSDGDKTPIVEFTPIDGERTTGKPTLHGSIDINKIRSYKNMTEGEVPVLYDPDDPKKFILIGENGFNYFASVIIVLVGLGIIIVGICIMSRRISVGGA